MKSNKDVFYTLLIAFMVLLSVFVLADDSNKGNSNSDSVDSDTNSVDVNGSNAYDSDLDIQDSRPGKGPEVKPERVSNNQVEVKNRIEQQKRIYEAAKERYQEAKDRYQEAKDAAKRNMQDFNAVRERLRTANESDKNALREQVKVHAAQTLINQIDAILNHLDAIKEKQVAPENIEEIIAFFEDAKTKLESETLTKEELTEISKEVRDFWKEHRLGLKKKLGNEINQRINAIVNKAKTFSERFSELITKLQEEGKDTALLERGMNKLNADIDKFEDAYAKVREMYANAGSEKDVDAVLKRGNRLLNVMNNQLKKDFRLIKLLFNATRELGKEEAISTETISEIESLIDEPTTELDEAIEELVVGDVNE